jgi:hypothetical protein
VSAADRGNRFAEGYIVWIDQAEVAKTEICNGPRGGADVQRIAGRNQNDCEFGSDVKSMARRNMRTSYTAR